MSSNPNPMRLVPCDPQADYPATIPMIRRGGKARLICPQCGFSHVEPVGLGCAPMGHSGGALAVCDSGAFWNPQVEPHGNGVEISLLFRCALGHVFGYEFHLHDGKTEVRRECDLYDGYLPPIWSKDDE